MKEVTFGCPALKEEGIIKLTISHFISKIEGLLDAYEIILIDGGSKGRAWLAMKDIQKKFPKNVRLFKNPENKNIISDDFFFQVECPVKLIRNGPTYVEVESVMGQNVREDKPRALTFGNFFNPLGSLEKK